MDGSVPSHLVLEYGDLEGLGPKKIIEKFISKGQDDGFIVIKMPKVLVTETIFDVTKRIFTPKTVMASQSLGSTKTRGVLITEYVSLEAEEKHFDFNNQSCRNIDMREIFKQLLKKPTEPKYYVANYFIDSCFHEIVNDEIWDLDDWSDVRNLSYLINGKFREGIHKPTWYVGGVGSLFPMHKEDGDIGGFNMCLSGHKVWLIVSPKHSAKLQELLNKLTKKNCSGLKDCTNPFRHKIMFLSPEYLDAQGIEYSIVRQSENDLIFVFPDVFHEGFNETTSLNWAMNVAPDEFLDKYVHAVSCECKSESSGFVLDLRPALYLREGHEYISRLNDMSLTGLISRELMTPEEIFVITQFKKTYVEQEDMDENAKTIRERFKHLKSNWEKETSLTSYRKNASTTKENLGLRVEAFLGISLHQLTYHLAVILRNVQSHSTRDVIRSILELAGGLVLKGNFVSREIDKILKDIKNYAITPNKYALYLALKDFAHPGVFSSFFDNSAQIKMKSVKHNKSVSKESIFNERFSITRAEAVVKLQKMELIKKMPKYKNTAYYRTNVARDINEIINYLLDLLGVAKEDRGRQYEWWRKRVRHHDPEVEKSDEETDEDSEAERVEESETDEEVDAD